MAPLMLVWGMVLVQQYYVTTMGRSMQLKRDVLDWCMKLW
jgi:hypothetical protein